MSLLRTTSQPVTSSSLKRIISGHPLLAYFVMAFAGTWIVFLPLLLARNGLGLLPFSLPVVPFQTIGAFAGPTLAAFIVTATTSGKAGLQQLLRRIVQWRVGVGWYLLALLGYPLIYVGSGIITLGMASLPTLLAQWSLFFTIYLPYLVVNLISTMGEEMGWVGYALPNLQLRIAPLLSAVTLGVLWALWHLPAFFVVGGLGPFSIVDFALFVVLGVGVRITWAWLFNKTMGSVIIIALLHAALNGTTVALPHRLPMIPPTATLLFLGLNVVVFPVLILILSRGRLSYRPGHEAMPMLSRTIISSFCISLLILSFSARPVAAASPAGAPDLASINAYVSAQMQANHLPGLALGIVHDKQVVDLRGFGTADPSGRAVSPQTPFIIGSLTKSFTALAILQLVEAGKVQLDAPVQHYLPWFRLADSTASARITVRQLLNQTSGIPSSLNGLNISEIATMNMEQFVHALKAVALDRPVGSRFEYANTNYVVLGLIVQTVSGQAYETYIQQHIFSPLDMQHSYASVEQARSNGLAQGYQWALGVPVPVDDLDLHNAHLLPAGLLTSTAEDMSHYLIAQLNNGHYGNNAVVSPTGIATMQTPAVSSATAFGPGSSYGMGWVSGPVAGVPAVYHDGITYTFHAYMLIEPHNHWGAVLLFNTDSILADGVAFKQIESGIARLLAGQQPAEASLSLNTLYLILDSLIALILALVVWSLLRLPRWYRLFGQRPEHRVRRVVLPLLRELVLPALLLLVTFTVFGGLWPQLIAFQSDLTYAYLVILGLMLITGIIRVVLAFLVLRRKATGASLLASSPPRQPGLA